MHEVFLVKFFPFPGEQFFEDGTHMIPEVRVYGIDIFFDFTIVFAVNSFFGVLVVVYRIVARESLRGYVAVPR